MDNKSIKLIFYKKIRFLLIQYIIEISNKQINKKKLFSSMKRGGKEFRASSYDELILTRMVNDDIICKKRNSYAILASLEQINQIIKNS